MFGMKHHLLDLYLVCTNYAPGAKMGLPQGSNVLHTYIEKTGKIFLSETTRPRALIFVVPHHLVDHYQVCSNYTTDRLRPS